jgi:hypothetical protein
MLGGFKALFLSRSYWQQRKNGYVIAVNLEFVLFEVMCSICLKKFSKSPGVSLFGRNAFIYITSLHTSMVGEAE